MRRRAGCARRRPRRPGGRRSLAAPCSPEKPRRAGRRSPRPPAARPAPRRTFRRCRSAWPPGRSRVGRSAISSTRRVGSSPMCQVPRPNALAFSPQGSLTVFISFYPWNMPNEPHEIVAKGHESRFCPSLSRCAFHSIVAVFLRQDVPPPPPPPPHPLLRIIVISAVRCKLAFVLSHRLLRSL